MFEFIRERAPIGHRGIFIYGIDDAMFAAIAEQAAAQGAAAGGTAAAQAGTGALAEGAVTAAPTIAEGAPMAAEAAPQGMRLNQAMAPLDAQHGGPQPGMDPMGSADNLSQGNLMAESMKPLAKVGEMMPNMNETSTNLGNGNIGAEIKNLDMGSRMPGNDMAPGAGDLASGLLGGGEAPPLPEPPKPDFQQSMDSLDAQHGEKAPSTPGTPMSMQDKAKLAHNTLRIASSLVTNKKDKQTLGLMSLSTALASNGGDLNNSMSSMTGPLADISAGIQEPRLNQALSPLSPSTQQQPPRAPVSQSASPATARGTGFTPPTRLTGDQFAMQPSQRMSRYY